MSRWKRKLREADFRHINVNQEVVKSEEVIIYAASQFYENVFIQIQPGEEFFPVLLILGSWPSWDLPLSSFSGWLALGGSQFAAKVLWRCIQQPISIHQTQVSHIVAGGVQKLVEDYIGWLGLE